MKKLIIAAAALSAMTLAAPAQADNFDRTCRIRRSAMNPPLAGPGGCGGLLG